MTAAADVVARGSIWIKEFTVARSRRTFRTADEWRAIFARFAKSGLTIRAFCERESLTPTSFHRWRARLERRPSPTASFTELPLPTTSSSDEETSGPSWTVELDLPGDIVLRVRG